ncbi:MAG: hypothetical protein KDD61_01565 [Bdellovibrionales bacterium]|nr:hypothetical protein [Bdellovibrionales bacterium]
MERALIKTFLMFILSLTLAFPAVAQQPEDAMAQSNGGLSGPRKQLSIIIFSGLAGAVLGLSTLSFYGRPQEKLSNIAIGAAIGIIGGATFTTYKAATNPYDTLGADLNPDIINKRWNDREQPAVPTLAYQWSF